MEWPRTEPGTLRWESSDKQSEPRQGLVTAQVHEKFRFQRYSKHLELHSKTK
jgi:hypothetical protein